MFPSYWIENVLAITRSEIITEKFVEQLKETGITDIGIGLETAAKNKQIAINKQQSLKGFIKKVLLLNNIGIRVKIFLIHFKDSFNTDTINLLKKLHQKGAKFFIQSSFYRPLFKKQSLKQLNFDRWDQRKDCSLIGLDSKESLAEWLICNLAFPSTDINSQSGKENLLKALLEKNIDELIEYLDTGEIILKAYPKYYFYKPPAAKFESIKPHIYVADNYEDITNF